MDIPHELQSWREPLRVLELARLIVISRPGSERVHPEEVDARIPGASRRITVVETPGVAISSTELRRRVAEGRSIRYLVPDSVAAYISEHGLYRTRQETGDRRQERSGDTADGKRMGAGAGESGGNPHS